MRSDILQKHDSVKYSKKPSRATSWCISKWSIIGILLWNWTPYVQWPTFYTKHLVFMYWTLNVQCRRLNRNIWCSVYVLYFNTFLFEHVLYVQYLLHDIWTRHALKNWTLKVFIECSVFKRVVFKNWTLQLNNTHFLNACVKKRNTLTRSIPVA